MKYQTKETLLKIEDVSLAFGSHVILKNMNAEIKHIPGKGQVVGLLGPSGIGKTQFFRILAGLLKPTTGTVKINSIAEPVHAGLVGVVPQDYPLFRHHRVLSNLVIAGKQAGMSEAKAVAAAWEYLKRFTLEGTSHLFPAQLSGGQRQRIAISRQLLCSEHFLLMDEPFSGLDPIMLDEVCGLITEVAAMDTAENPKTIIVVTHDIRAAVKVADTLWLMGRDRDGEGNIIPGAYLKVSYDLIEMDLAWHKDISATPQFTQFAHEIKEQFRVL
jgi:NitT/TauT family transport system ATP-binding protein